MNRKTRGGLENARVNNTIIRFILMQTYRCSLSALGSSVSAIRITDIDMATMEQSDRCAQGHCKMVISFVSSVVPDIYFFIFYTLRHFRWVLVRVVPGIRWLNSIQVCMRSCSVKNMYWSKWCLGISSYLPFSPAHILGCVFYFTYGPLSSPLLILANVSSFCLMGMYFFHNPRHPKRSKGWIWTFLDLKHNFLTVWHAVYHPGLLLSMW